MRVDDAVPDLSHTPGGGAAPGGRLYDDGLWRLEHAVEPVPMLGWLVAKPVRHVEFLDDMTAEEAASMANVLRRGVGALRCALAVPPEKVYVALFAESTGCPHIHFHLIPRAPDHPTDTRGPQVFTLLSRAAKGEGEAPPLPEIEALAARIGACLAQGS